LPSISIIKANELSLREPAFLYLEYYIRYNFAFLYLPPRLKNLTPIVEYLFWMHVLYRFTGAAQANSGEQKQTLPKTIARDMGHHFASTSGDS